ncbi:MAG: FAD-binding and (Fe-S)-binding domain-containing protein [Thiohalocapsa sp.]
MDERYQSFRDRLRPVLPDKLFIEDYLRRLAYGTDASFYRLVPELVIKIRSEADLRLVLDAANRHQVSVTFRAAGTSLSGQAVTNSALVVMDGDAWRDHAIGSDAETIRLQPGIIGAQANALLAPFGRKIGPDPASICTAKIGGIAANNASGMCCGVDQNSYHTLAGMRVILADGTLLDTGDEDSRNTFARSHAHILHALTGLNKRVRDDEALAERISRKFSIKNTTGYSLNALVDFEDPFEILQHLMIGSEGTLGFIAEVTYRTVPEHPCKASNLVFFHDVESACHAVAALKSQPIDAVEIMDRAALRSVEDKPGMPDALKALPADAAALLIETRAETVAGLEKHIARIDQCLDAEDRLSSTGFTAVPEEFAKLWNIRKGLFPSVGAVRAAGTAVVIEDVAFPVPMLAAATLDLQALFAEYGYQNAIIFGHALEGNLHFVITPDFNDPTQVKVYKGFMDALSRLVVERYDGSLKAEHSTGRNMAPFVELEWGKQAYALMREIKSLFDPNGLLNPGVILNGDPLIHVKNLKPMPAADALVDRCIECGFCEPICPSRNLSLTPRQRIVVLRERARLEATGEGPDLLETLVDDYAWQGEGTCAADGLCATRCPVDIDTGAMMKRLRAEGRGPTAIKVGHFVERHMGGATAVTRLGMGMASILSRLTGSRVLEKSTSGLRKLSGNRFPTWDRWMPRPAGAMRPPTLTSNAAKRVVYLPSCTSRSMGTAVCDTEERDLQEVTLSLLSKAGFEVVQPDGVNALCCGLPFASKGLEDPARSALERTEEALWKASEQGLLPVLCDTSPCTARMIEGLSKPISVQEPVGFVLEHLLPQLRQVRKLDKVALHVTCSARKLGLDGDFLALAETCADQVFQPEERGCCGFAGDKGFTTPELNRAALSRLKQQLPDDCESGYSNSRTCEIGLSRHSGISYRSILYLVDACFESRQQIPALLDLHNDTRVGI